MAMCSARPSNRLNPMANDYQFRIVRTNDQYHSIKGSTLEFVVFTRKAYDIHMASYKRMIQSTLWMLNQQTNGNQFQGGRELRVGTTAISLSQPVPSLAPNFFRLFLSGFMRSPFLAIQFLPMAPFLTVPNFSLLSSSSCSLAFLSYSSFWSLSSCLYCLSWQFLTSHKNSINLLRAFLKSQGLLQCDLFQTLIEQAKARPSPICSSMLIFIAVFSFQILLLFCRLAVRWPAKVFRGEASCRSFFIWVKKLISKTLLQTDSSQSEIQRVQGRLVSSLMISKQSLEARVYFLSTLLMIVTNSSGVIFSYIIGWAGYLYLTLQLSANRNQYIKISQKMSQLQLEAKEKRKWG